tara:strand:+ start:24123 stop:24296 length:174 start_codon:yes stop_codon:yes gene_type:complete
MGIPLAIKKNCIEVKGVVFKVILLILRKTFTLHLDYQSIFSFFELDKLTQKTRRIGV